VRRTVLRPNRNRWACGGDIRDLEHYAGRHGKDCESKTNSCRTHLIEFPLKLRQIVLVAVLNRALKAVSSLNGTFPRRQVAQEGA
jgi:hypothetical protein